jgi:hypothetical protein
VRSRKKGMAIAAVLSLSSHDKVSRKNLIAAPRSRRGRAR